MLLCTRLARASSPAAGFCAQDGQGISAVETVCRRRISLEVRQPCSRDLAALLAGASRQIENVGKARTVCRSSDRAGPCLSSLPAPGTPYAAGDQAAGLAAGYWLEHCQSSHLFTAKRTSPKAPCPRSLTLTYSSWPASSFTLLRGSGTDICCSGTQAVPEQLAEELAEAVFAKLGTRTGGA